MAEDFTAVDQMAIPQGTLTAPEESNPPPLCGTQELVRCPGCGQQIMVASTGEYEEYNTAAGCFMGSEGSAECQVCQMVFHWHVNRVSRREGV